MQERARSYASERFCSGGCLSSHGVQVSRWDWLRSDDGATGNRRGLNYLCQLSQFVDSSESSITVAFRDNGDLKDVLTSRSSCTIAILI